MISAKEALELTNKAKELPNVLFEVEKAIRRAANNQSTNINIISDEYVKEINERNSKGRSNVNSLYFAPIINLSKINTLELIGILRGLKYKASMKEFELRTCCQEVRYDNITIPYIGISWEK